MTSLFFERASVAVPPSPPPPGAPREHLRLVSAQMAARRGKSAAKAAGRTFRPPRSGKLPKCASSTQKVQQMAKKYSTLGFCHRPCGLTGGGAAAAVDDDAAGDQGAAAAAAAAAPAASLSPHSGSSSGPLNEHLKHLRAWRKKSGELPLGSGLENLPNAHDVDPECCSLGQSGTEKRSVMQHVEVDALTPGWNVAIVQGRAGRLRT